MIRLSRYLNIIFICFIIFLFINLQQLLFLTRKQRFFKKLIHSDININSFNPSIIHLKLNIELFQSNILSIIDNNIILIEISNTSIISITLSDGYHHLNIILYDRMENIEFYQTIDIITGNQILFVTVLNKKNKPVENISVYLELIDYSHINIEHKTNEFGQVIFHYLPNNIQVYIEAICMNTKRYTYVEINTFNYRNITLILKELDALYDDEYNSLDRGFYAI